MKTRITLAVHCPFQENVIFPRFNFFVSDADELGKLIAEKIKSYGLEKVRDFHVEISR